MIRVNWLALWDMGQVERTQELSIVELQALLARPESQKKNSVGLVVGATFVGNKRNKASCLSRNVIPIDVDHGLSLQEVTVRLHTLNVSAVLHTTASHTEDNHRFRVFVELAQDLTPTQWSVAQAWVRANFPEADTNALDIARVSYAPVKTAGYTCKLFAGKPLQLDPLQAPESPVKALDESPGPNLSERAQKLATLFLGALPPKGHRQDFYLELTGFLVKLELSRPEIKAIVCSLCESSGALHMLGNRLSLVDTTYHKLQTGEPIGGSGLVAAMQLAVGSERVAQAIEQEALRIILPRPVSSYDEPMPELPKVRRQHNPAHVYKYKAGEMGSAGNKPAKLSQNDLQRIFKSDPDWDGVMQFDEFTSRIIAVDPPFRMDAEKGDISKTDVTNVRAWLGAHNAQATAEEVSAALDAIAKSNRFNPVIEFLESCSSVDGSIERIAREVLLIVDPLQLKLFRLFMLSAVRRAMYPGCKVDTCFVLHGPQGALKSTFFSTMFGPWFADDIPSIRGVDGKRWLVGKWCVEFAELDRLVREETETVKSFLSTAVDRFDEKYQNTRDYPRACVFVGSSNTADFLRDASGERRFWPVHVEHIQIENLTDELRRGAWGEAVAAIKAGEAHWLTTQADKRLLEEQQEEYKLQDPIEQPVIEYIKGKDKVYFNELLKHLQAFHEYAVKAQNTNLALRASRVLMSLGCVRRRRATERFWVIPDTYAEQKQASVNLPFLEQKK